jgi:hypothetical protein
LYAEVIGNQIQESSNIIEPVPNRNVTIMEFFLIKSQHKKQHKNVIMTIDYLIRKKQIFNSK